MRLFNELDDSRSDKKRSIRAPFGCPGSKFKLINDILPYLPYRDTYVEPFGGTGIVLMSREKSPLEVFNDRHSGITCFYICLQDRDKLNKLIEMIELSIHSREFWNMCFHTWEGEKNEIERAFKWYYMTQYSFSQIGKIFARSTKNKNHDSGKIYNNIKHFSEIHQRLRNVLIENLDWREVIDTFDRDNAVFYFDPPYLNSYSAYKHILKDQDHIDLCERIMNMQSYVVLSGYDNKIYDSYKWDDRIVIDHKCNIGGMAKAERKDTEEVLWVKE